MTGRAQPENSGGNDAPGVAVGPKGQMVRTRSFRPGHPQPPFVDSSIYLPHRYRKEELLSALVIFSANDKLAPHERLQGLEDSDQIK